MNENRGWFAESAARLARRLWPLALLPLWACPTYADPAAAAPSYPAMAPLEQYMYPSPAVEITLAKTAAPKSISDNATILVLTKTGYETAVNGSNGFVCYVDRSWSKDFDSPEFWNPKDNTPQCWNAAAVSSVFPEILKRTQWVLAGVSKEEMLARTKAAWAAHEFLPPAPESVAYMMSRDQHINDPQPGAPANWHPHVMFFVPATEDSKWGANLPGSPVISTTSDVDPITTFFVVAPKWSDGSLAPYVATPAAATATVETHHH
jgi:hypothetical protein